jgi:O-antigen/teichoic acid export membrane protein
VSDAASTIQSPLATTPNSSPSFRGRFVRNIIASLVRVAAVSLAAVFLPAFLTHHLPVATYAAWVLILQLGAYVSYLDLGIQTGISKFVAEFEAKGDRAEAGRHASAGLGLMILTGLVGVIVTAVLAWQVPRLFSKMPPNLYHDVRVSLLLVGFSLSFGLICAVYSAVFIGLQRYWIPMTLAIANRASYAMVVLVIVTLHGNLAAMGISVAIVNITTGLLQIVAWHKEAAHIPVILKLAKYRVIKTVAIFCSFQSIWTIAMLCIAGLDVTIVGHYDYGQTGYYSIATLPTNFFLLILSAVLNPLLPASSAMSTHRTPKEMGALLAKTTRYATLILFLTGLPLVVCGSPLLRLWVGASYAAHTVDYLRILVIANVIRNLCAPYATMVVGTGRQAPATVSAVCEAVVNLGSSIYLASRFGAIGVAIGTVLGSFVSIGLHFVISMHFTQGALAISRSKLFLKGMLRPAAIAVPSLVLELFRWQGAQSALSAPWVGSWTLTTLALAWYVALDRDERDYLKGLLGKRLLAATSV